MRAASRSSGCARSFSSPRRSRSFSQRWRATPSPVLRSVPSRRCGAKQRTSRPRRRTAGSRCLLAKDEVQRLAETLNDMLARLETAFEHERQFVADASHELRTPLALLKTELELALRHPRSRAELKDALRSAAEETDRLSALASDLLLIARSDQSGLPVHPEPLSSGDVLATVADRFSGRAAELGRRIEVEDGHVGFDADPERIEQALGNLVENALVHGAGTVTIGATRRDGQVELRVVDQGPGFPDGFAERAFDRFSRADEARRRSGSGLGLAIVEAIALAHGGQAGVSPGARTAVWISLPARPEPRRPKGRPSLTSQLEQRRLERLLERPGGNSHAWLIQRVSCVVKANRLPWRAPSP